ncbi:MAG TPA: hypothetical protein VGH84_06775, partial [Steroidobacteraceae bacterium]
SANRRSGFAEFCNSVVGESAADQLRSACGYDSLLHPHLPIEAGFSILNHHPETESLFNGRATRWLCLRDGLQALAQAMMRELGDDVDLHMGAELKAIERPTGGDRGYRLRFTSDRGAFRDRADLVILAALPQDAQRIHGWPGRSSDGADATLEGIPLLKGYVQFEKAWWNESFPDSNCVIADTPLRKLYITAGSRTLWFYCDGPSARALNGILETCGGLPTELLERHLGCRLPKGTDADQCRWKFWESGIGFYRNSPPSKCQSSFMALAPDLLLCSDIFTDHLGWAEGCLISAQAAVQYLQSTSALNGSRQLALAA